MGLEEKYRDRQVLGSKGVSVHLQLVSRIPETSPPPRHHISLYTSSLPGKSHRREQVALCTSLFSPELSPSGNIMGSSFVIQVISSDSHSNQLGWDSCQLSPSPQPRPLLEREEMEAGGKGTCLRVRASGTVRALLSPL